MVPLAYLVLFSFPVVAALIYMRLPPERAVIAIVLVGYLFLPGKVGLNLPAVPTINKELVPGLTALLLCLLMPKTGRGDPPRPGWLPGHPLILILVLTYLFSPILTTALNGDAFRVGPRFVIGMRPYDVGAMFYSQFAEILPFLLALRYLGSERSQQDLVKAIVIGGLVYSLFILIELRMSPQINRWLYGFYQFKFVHEVRGGEFRPVVFLQGGLWTALFIAAATITAAAWWRAAARQERGQAMAVTLWLGVLLSMMSSLAAFLVALVLAPGARFGSRILLSMFAASLGLAVLLYPMLRSADAVPTTLILSTMGAVSEKRVGSLEFRLENEDRLLAHANERPIFGWGGWGRNRVYDPRTGGDTTTVDARWILTFGQRGWVGYIAEYGLLTAPLLLLWRNRKRVDGWTLGLALALCASLVDMMLNDTLTPVVWLTAGAVLARILERRSLPEDAAMPSRPRPAIARPQPVLGALAPRSPR